MPVLIQWRREMEKFFERYFGEFYAMVFFYADMMFYYLRCRRGSLVSGDPPTRRQTGKLALPDGNSRRRQRTSSTQR